MLFRCALSGVNDRNVAPFGMLDRVGGSTSGAAIIAGQQLVASIGDLPVANKGRSTAEGAVIGADRLGWDAHLCGDCVDLAVESDGAAMQNERGASDCVAHHCRICRLVAVASYADDHALIIAQRAGAFNG